MYKNQARFVTVNALAIALVCVSTMMVQIPIPLGYMHFGNVCILLAGVFFGPATGLLAGGIGSALADLLSGYAVWALPTLAIKSLMGFTTGYLAWGGFGRIRVRMCSARTAAATVAGVLIMSVGYVVAGTFLYHSIPAGLAQLPGLALEGVLGAVLFYALGLTFEKARISRMLGAG